MELANFFLPSRLPLKLTLLLHGSSGNSSYFSFIDSKLNQNMIQSLLKTEEIVLLLKTMFVVVFLSYRSSL